MEIGKIPVMIVSIVVAIVVCAGILIPAIDQSTETHKLYTNDGLYKMDKIDVDYTVNVTWDHTAPQVINFGSVAVDMQQYPAGTYTMIGSENFNMRYYDLGSGNVGIQIYGDNQNYSANTTAGTDMAISISAGTMTANNGGTAKSYTIGDHGYIYDFDGDGKYVMKSAADPVYVLGDSDIVSINASIVYTGVTVGSFVSGNIDDGFTGSTYLNGAYSVTFGNITTQSDEVSGYKDLYELSELDVEMTQNGTTKTGLFKTLIVPAEVNAELAVHLDQSQIVVLSVIPLLILVAILIAAVVLIGRE